MRRHLTASILLAGALVLAGACNADREPTAPAAPAPTFSNSHGGGQAPLDHQIEQLIVQLFPRPGFLVVALVRFESIEFLMKKHKTKPAQKQAMALADFALERYRHDQLIGDHSSTTQTRLQLFIDLLFQYTGLGSTPIPPGAFGDDGAVAVVGPDGGMVVTGTGLAGVNVPANAFDQTVILTIDRNPSQFDPLPTELDQVPPFYEFHTFPEIPQFGQPVIVGICVDDASIPQGRASFLRIAHELHSDPSAVEILPLANAPFLVCPTTIPAAPQKRPSQFADNLLWMMMGAPRDLQAESRSYLNPGGLGGRTSSFSTFGAVDAGSGVFLPYQEIGYRYLELGPEEAPPAGFEQPGFDASSWSVGQGAFGGGTVANTCPALTGTIHTSWPAASDGAVQLLLRKAFSGTAQNVQIQVPVDNDVQVFVNGIDITASGGTVDEDGFLEHEGCADPEHPFVFTIDNSHLNAAGNWLVIRARDRGVVSYVDARITGDFTSP
jgi:hypothetical protein